MTRRLGEQVVRLSALSGWVTPWPDWSRRSPWPLHWAVPAVADEIVQGVAACGLRLTRDLQWRAASEHALRDAAGDGDLWQLCGCCLYWGGGLP